MIASFPLQWPEGFPRSKDREAGRFNTSLSKAIQNVETSIRLFGKDSNRPTGDVVLSSNYGGLKPVKISDPGVAAWFLWDGEMRCIAVDRYNSVEANLQAIHLIIEARRTEMRHGTLALVRAAFKGFVAALPAPGSKPWHDILGVPPNATAEQIRAAHRKLAQERHPDAGGSHEMMADLNRARDVGLKENGHG